MNVSCTQCGKRYVVADAKLAGKASAKIRCRQCGTVVTLSVGGSPDERSPAPAAAVSVMDVEADGADESTVVAHQVDDAAAWFAMVSGKQLGPMDLRALGDKAASKELTLRTYLWKNGMAEWRRASDIPEVASILRKAQSPAQPPPPPLAAPTLPASTAADIGASRSAPVAAADVQARPSRAPKGSLHGLFDDISQEVPVVARPWAQGGQDDAAEDHEGIATDEGSTDPSGGEGSASARFDPFSALVDASKNELAPPGEATRFFIAQAGVNKRNPPWKIALFLVSLVGGPVLLLFLLSSLHIVDLPTVSRTTEDGVVVQESFFSPSGMSGLKDLLTGEEERRRLEAEAKAAAKAKEREALAAAQRLERLNARAERPERNLGSTGTGSVETIDVGGTKLSGAALAAFYEDDGGKQAAIPRSRVEDKPAMNTGSGLSQEAISKVVADKQKAFTACIDNALRRKPDLAVGAVTVVLNVGPSGAVKSAAVTPKKHEGEEWAQCMMAAGKRIVFPASDDETEVQLPFKIGVAMSL